MTTNLSATLFPICHNVPQTSHSTEQLFGLISNKCKQFALSLITRLPFDGRLPRVPCSTWRKCSPLRSHYCHSALDDLMTIYSSTLGVVFFSSSVKCYVNQILAQIFLRSVLCTSQKVSCQSNCLLVLRLMFKISGGGFSAAESAGNNVNSERFCKTTDSRRLVESHRRDFLPLVWRFLTRNLIHQGPKQIFKAES